MWWSVFKRSWFCCRLPRLDFCLHKCWSLKCPLHVLFNVFVFYLSFILLQEKHGIVLLAWCLFCPWNAQIAVKVNKYSLSMRNVCAQMQFLFWFTRQRNRSRLLQQYPVMEDGGGSKSRHTVQPHIEERRQTTWHLRWRDEITDCCCWLDFVLGIIIMIISKGMQFTLG